MTPQDDKSPRTIGALIRDARKIRDMRQHQFRRIMGIGAPSTISQWENDLHFPAERHWPKLADFLGIPREEIEALRKVRDGMLPDRAPVRYGDNVLLGKEELEYLLRVVQSTGCAVPLKHAAYYLKHRTKEEHKD